MSPTVSQSFPAGLSLRTQVNLRTHFERVRPQLVEVEARIREQILSFDPGISGLLEDATGQSGKRIRPALVLLSAEASGGIHESHYRLAVIVELIHLASLVHDDILDGAETRRAKPTLFAKWGVELAVLLGDFLFAHALKLTTKYDDTSVARKIADAAHEVCAGEILQTQRKFDVHLSPEEYFRFVAMKTGALFRCSCEVAAWLNGREEEASALREYGEWLGLAYQIYDDCLDLFGREETSGKTLGTDLAKGKLTLPVLFMLQNLRAEDVGRITRVILSGSEEERAALVADIEAYEGHLFSVKTARDYLARASSAVQRVKPGPAAQALQSIPDTLSEHLQSLSS